MDYLVVTFVLLSCIRVWTWPEPVLAAVNAQIPDSGMQRQRLLDEARRTNQLLLEIKQILRNHTFNVRVQGADDQTAAPAKSRRGRP